MKPLILFFFLGSLCTLVSAGEEVRFVETQEEFSKALQLNDEDLLMRRGPKAVVESDLATLELSDDLPRVRVRLQFDTGTARIGPESRSILDNFGRALHDADAIILVEGHADNVGSAEVNQDLSERRAQAAVDYLIRTHGIPQHQLHRQGFGENRPIASNVTPEGRAMNRRVEFVRIQ